MMNKAGGGGIGGDANGSMRIEAVGFVLWLMVGRAVNNGYQVLHCSRKTVALPHGSIEHAHDKCSEPSEHG